MHKRYAFLLIMVMASIGSIGCKKAELTPEEQNAQMMGTFVRGDATLRVDDVNEGYQGQNLDFQLEYHNPEVGDGTLFGAAEETDYRVFKFEYETSKAVFTFDGENWYVAYGATDMVEKKRFDYTGKYTRKNEPEH